MVVVTHEGVIRAAVAHVLALPAGQHPPVSPRNGMLTVIGDEPGWSVLALNTPVWPLPQT